MKYIIDTDPGIDDAIAICMAVKSNLNIIGFTLANGNVGQDKSSRNLIHIQDILGTNIKMYKGEKEKPGSHEIAEYAHGKDGLGYYTYPDISNKKYERTKAENFIIKSARKYKDDLTLICLGSLTNLSNALKKDKNLTKYLKHVVIMGAAYDPKKDEQYKDFNIRSNLKAAKLVYETPFDDVKIVTHEVGLKSFIEKKYIENLKNSSDKVSRFIYLISEKYMDFAKERHGTNGLESPDPVTIASILDSSIVKFKPCEVKIVSRGENKGESKITIKEDSTHMISISSDIKKYRELFKSIFK